MISGPESGSLRACEDTVLGSGAERRLEDNPSSFFDFGEPDLPQGVMYSGEVILRGFLFRHVIRSVAMKRKYKRKLIGRYYCIKTRDTQDLPDFVLTCHGHGYRSIDGFINCMKHYRETVYAMRAKRPERWNVNGDKDD